VFGIMRAMPRLFGMLTNFTLIEFDELATLLVTTIVSHARSIGGH
jgi:hypothetical protein